MHTPITYFQKTINCVVFADLPQGASTEGVDMRGLEEQRRVEQERELQAVLKRLQRDYRYQNLVPVISQHGTPQVRCLFVLISTSTGVEILLY